MSIHRIHLSSSQCACAGVGDSLEIVGTEAHHAASVKRIAPGCRVRLFDGSGWTADAVVRSAARKRLVVELIEHRHVTPPEPRLVLAAPPPKGARAEWMIDQISQAGAALWIPLVTERSVVQPSESRIEKWRMNTVVESARQCGRDWAMEIDPQQSIDSVLSKWGVASLQAPVLVADADGQPCREALSSGQLPQRLLLVVGPEGGLTDVERDSLERTGAVGVALGPNTLRIETAAVVGVGMLAAWYGPRPAPGAAPCAGS